MMTDADRNRDNETPIGEPGAPALPQSDPLELPAWSTGTAIAITSFVIVITFVGGVAAAALSTLDLAPDLLAAVMGAALAAPYLMALVTVGLIARRRGLSLADSVALRRAPVSRVVPLALAVAFGARIMAGLWTTLLQQMGVRLPGAEADPTMVLPPGAVGVALTLLAVCVLAPLAEEVVFRGILLPALAERWGATPGIVVSSIAFAVVHLHPYAIVPIFVLALVLGRLFLTSRTLWLPVAVHAAFNTIGIVAVYALRGAGVL